VVGTSLGDKLCGIPKFSSDGRQIACELRSALGVEVFRKMFLKLLDEGLLFFLRQCGFILGLLMPHLFSFPLGLLALGGVVLIGLELLGIRVGIARVERGVRWRHGELLGIALELLGRLGL